MNSMLFITTVYMCVHYSYYCFPSIAIAIEIDGVNAKIDKVVPQSLTDIYH